MTTITPEQIQANLAQGFGKLYLPHYMQDGITRYVMHGHRVGDFLTSLLENNLSRACANADAQNQEMLVSWVKFLWNYVPAGAWGDPKKVKAWQEQGGIIGRATPPELNGGAL